MTELPASALRALEYLAANGPTFCRDIPDKEYVWFLHLKEKGLVKMELPDPNFLYLLPPEKQDWYQMKITGEGFVLLHLLQEKLQKEKEIEAKREAERESDRVQAVKDKKKDRRHDFLVAAFGAAVALLFEHIGDVVDAITVMLERILLLLG